MRTSTVLAVLAVVLGGLACNSTTGLQTNFGAALGGDFETPPLTSTGGANATFTVNGLTINYTLNITAAAASNYTNSHIHTGAAAVSGPVQVTLCSTTGIPMTCPTSTGTVTGSFTATSGSQLLGTVTYDSLVKAMRNRATYANVHSVTNGGGEIRGQILPTEQPKQ